MRLSGKCYHKVQKALNPQIQEVCFFLGGGGGVSGGGLGLAMARLSSLSPVSCSEMSILKF